MGDAPAEWKAGIVVILTPSVWPEKATVRVPPRMVPMQGEVRGTVTILFSPVTVTGQLPGAVPVMSLIFCVKKAGCSPPTRTADLCTLASSGALPLLGNAKEMVDVPAQFAWNTSPIWST